MADLAEIEARVKQVVSEVLEVPLGDIDLEHHFVEDLDAQSIQSIELVAAFEEAFDLDLDEDAALAVQTVGGAVEFLAKVLAEKGS